MSDIPEGRRPRRVPLEIPSDGVPWNWIVGGVVAFVALVVLIVMATGFKKTPRDEVGLSYGGGPIEGAHFQQVVEPGHGLFFNGVQDKLYLYPVTQRNRPECTVWMKLKSARASFENICMRRSAMKRWPR